MLSYRHIYHAGNFADVFKHVVLTQLLRMLQRKTTPMCYLDTHGGAGRYDLMAAPATRNAEYTTGILRLWSAPEVPDMIADYLSVVRACNPDSVPDDSSTLQYYPGSPRIARTLLRPQDRMIVCELHPTDVQRLREEFQDDKQVAIHHQDGYQGLKAFLPPKEKRGLVLIDPPYELKDEFQRLYDHLATAVARWPTGCFALWYPILADYPITRLHQQLCDSGIRKIMLCELNITRTASERMTGSGMVLVNPPWQLDTQLNTVLPWLSRCLARDASGDWAVRWLVPE